MICLMICAGLARLTLYGCGAASVRFCSLFCPVLYYIILCSFLFIDSDGMQESWGSMADEKAYRVWSTIWTSLGGEYAEMSKVPVRKDPHI